MKARKLYLPAVQRMGPEQMNPGLSLKSEEIRVSGQALMDRSALARSIELGEGVLDRVEVGTVWRQEHKLRTGLFDRIADSGGFVGRQIVHHDDVDLRQGRDQNLLNTGEEHVAVHGAVVDEGRGHARQP